MECINCGASLKAGAKFCPHCAFDLSQAAQNRAMAETQVLQPQPRACSNCGAALTEGARFCMNCATPVAAGPGHQGPVYGGQPAAQAPAHNDYNSYPVAHVQRNLKPFIIGAAILGLLIGAALASYFLFFSGSGGPSDVAKRYVRALESGNGQEMLNLLSRGQLARMGIDRTNEAQMSLFNAGLAEAAAEIKTEGGISQVETKNEKITGDTATVDVTLKPGQGEAKTRTLRFVREDGQWKIDELPGGGAQSSSGGPAVS